MLRSPAKAPLVFPTHALALAVAAEWEWQEQRNLRPFTMPIMARCAALHCAAATRRNGFATCVHLTSSLSS
jgi:ATP synthase F1 complex assembly factor 2